MENLLLYIIICILGLEFLFDSLLGYLNIQASKRPVPEILRGIYDNDKYLKSMSYEQVTTYFSILTSAFNLILILGFIFFDGFAYTDQLVRSISSSPIVQSLLFFGILMFALDILNLPFSIYSVFVIEEQYGFNKMTLKTFVLDKIKSWIISIIIGGLLVSFIVWVYTLTQDMFWLYAWLFLGLFMVFMTMFYTSLIVPLFNKLTPLEEGRLKDEILSLGEKVNFKIENVYKMDGSKRSSKANAYFSGLGKRKKIVLFDTLIESLSEEEITAVLAHEIGHYKKKHTLGNIILSLLQTGITLYILSLFIDNPYLSGALGVEESSFYIGVIAFGMLYTPISTILGIFMNMYSRKNEYEADAYAADHYKGDRLIDALKKLSENNLTNLLPHPLYVFVNYSHPPLLDRIQSINKSN